MSIVQIPPSASNPPPPSPQDTPPDSTPSYKEEEVDRLLDCLTESADDWETDLSGQAAAVIFLMRAWGSTVERQRERAWQLCKNRLRRLRFVEGGEVEQYRTFLRLVNLTEETDVRRAVRVHPDQYLDFHSEPDERVYESVGGWLKMYLECVKYSQIPLAYHFWMGVLALSAACRRNVYIELNADQIWMDQYIFLVGPRGSGKSDAMKYARDVLIRMNGQLWDVDLHNKREDRYEWQVNLLPEDASQEYIVNELEAIGQRYIRDEFLQYTNQLVDATALLLIDEMSVHYGEDNWAVKKKIPFYTSIFGRGYYGKGTIKRGRQEIKNMGFSMAGCSAPEWMRDVVTPHVLKGGFVDRTLYIYRTHTHRSYSQFDRPIIDPLLLEDLAGFLTVWAKPPLNMKRHAEFTPAAEDWIRDRYHKDRAMEIEALDEGRLMEERTSLVRSSNQILKLAVLLAMSEGNFPYVDLSHLQRAISILEIEDTYFSAFLGEVRRTKHADVMDRIKDFFRKNDWEVKHSVLYQRFKNSVGLRNVMHNYVQTLLEDESILKDTRGEGVWYVWIGEK